MQFIKEKEFALVQDKVQAKMEDFFAKPVTDHGKLERQETNIKELMDSPTLH